MFKAQVISRQDPPKAETYLQKLQPGDDPLGIQNGVVMLGVDMSLQRHLLAACQVLSFE